MALVGAPAALRGDRGQVFMGLRDGSRGKSETCGWGFPTCARGPWQVEEKMGGATGQDQLSPPCHVLTETSKESIHWSPIFHALG